MSEAPEASTRGSMRAGPGKLLRSGSRWLRYVVLRRGLRSEHRGVPLVMHRAGPDHVRACLEKVRAALDLIAEHDADRLTELRERFEQVLIWYGPAPANGSYLHSQRLCELNCEYVEKAETEPARVAMTLVHELTHARLMETADPKRPMSLPQAEWLCIGSEIAFAKKLPDAEHLVSAAQRRMDRRPEFYSPEAHAERTLETLRALNPPGWLMRLMERLHERRFGRPPGSARPNQRGGV